VYAFLIGKNQSTANLEKCQQSLMESNALRKPCWIT